jgi:hypothetical protein
MIEILYGGGTDVINESWGFFNKKNPIPATWLYPIGWNGFYYPLPTTHKAPRVPYPFLFFLFLSLSPSRMDPSPSSFSFLLLSSFFFFASPSDPQRERRESEIE